MIRTLAAGNRRLPFAIAPVEHENHIAGRQPQHIAEIVTPVAVQRDADTGREGGVDEQAGTAKIGERHWLIPSGCRLLAERRADSPNYRLRARPCAALSPNSTGC